MAKRKPINWRQRAIEVLESKDKKFTEEDWTRASDWNSCAVGEWHARMPQVVVYTKRQWEFRKLPADKELQRLGCLFPAAVGRNRHKRVQEILDQIDDRVLVLKREAAHESQITGD